MLSAKITVSAEWNFFFGVRDVYHESMIDLENESWSVTIIAARVLHRWDRHRRLYKYKRINHSSSFCPSSWTSTLEITEIRRHILRDTRPPIPSSQVGYQWRIAIQMLTCVDPSSSRSDSDRRTITGCRTICKITRAWMSWEISQGTTHNDDSSTGIKVSLLRTSWKHTEHNDTNNTLKNEVNFVDTDPNPVK